MIKEDYVSFEVARLLKEKGFDIPCRQSYFNGSLVDYTMYGFCDGELLDCPSQSLALKWLREVHKLDIDVSIEYKNSKKVYYYSILKKTVIRDIDCLHSETNFDSYEQAVEASLLYVLKNLI